MLPVDVHSKHRKSPGFLQGWIQDLLDKEEVGAGVVFVGTNGKLPQTREKRQAVKGT